jgi:hypothetical protein
MTNPMKCLLKILLGIAISGNAFLFGQTKVQGQIIDAQTGAPLQGATVASQGTEIPCSTITDEQGKFEIQCQHPIQRIQVSALGYNPYQQAGPFNQNVKPIALETRSVELAPVVIQERGMERVLEDKTLYVIDYAWEGENLWVIYQKMGTRQPMLALIDERDSIIATEAGPERPRSFFTDCKGKVYVLGDQYACQIGWNKGKIEWELNEMAHFEREVRPCEAYLPPYTIRKMIRCNGQMQNYIAYDQGNREVGVLCHIMNKEKIHQLLDPYSIYAGLIRSEAHLYSLTETEWNQIAKLGPEFMFEQRAFFYPIPAPIKVLHNQYYIFDHTNGLLKTYTPTGDQLDEVRINYHQMPRWQKQDILTDPIRNEAYAIFKRGTWTQLREIDLDTGQLLETYEIPQEHISRITIRGGTLYFLYRQANYEDVNRLFRWRIK